MKNHGMLASLVRCALVVGLVNIMVAPTLAATMNLKRVLLSSGGVGYFEYEAQVEGAAELTLEAPLNQVDDILKSLIVYDNLGNVGNITLPGKESLEQVFRDLPFGAEAFASAVDLLNALQGAGVEIKGGNALQGRLLKVTADTVLLPNNLGSTTRHRISVLTVNGLQQAVLEDIEALRFTDPALQDQVQKALIAINEHRAHDRRALRLQVTGESKRTVRAGYVVEAPLWKTSYRLSLAANPQPNAPTPSRLQGWALLENMSGHDWEGVELTLASGSPVTFRQALYQAYYVKRPAVPVEVLGRVLPRPDTGAVATKPASPLPPPTSSPKPSELEERINAVDDKLNRMFKKSMSDGGGSHDASREQTVTGKEEIEQVLFTLPTPVSVKNGYAVMLPIIDRALPALRVSLFQPSTQEEYPLASVQLVNDTPTSLPPGVITIYEHNNYLGDGRLAALPAGDKRLVSFATDTKIGIHTKQEQTSTVSKGTISDGILHLTTLEKQTTLYQIKSLHADDRLLWIEPPQQEGWNLIAPENVGIELAKDHHRIPLLLQKGAETQLPVVLQSPNGEELTLIELETEQILRYSSSGQLDEPLKQAFAVLGEWRGQIDGLQKELAQLEEQRQALFKDQERLRENLARAPANSDLAKRYLKKLDTEENALEALNTQNQEKRGNLEKRQQQLAKYIRDLAL